MKDYIIIVGESGIKRDLFYVFSRDDFNFLYSFGINGKGPNEFLMPTTVQHAPDNCFLVFDNPTNKYYSYKITNTEAILDQMVLLHRNNEYTPMQAIAYVNDSIILYSIVSKNTNRLSSFNIKNSTIIDSLNLESDFKSTIENSFNPELTSYHFDYSNGQVVIACRYVDEMVLTSIDSNYRFPFNTVKLQNADFTPETNMMDNINYYVYTAISDNYIFTQRYGRPLKELQPFNLARNFKFDMEVLNRIGEPVAILRFDNNMLTFIVDEKYNCIYSWDPLDNLDYINKYSLDALPK